MQPLIVTFAEHPRSVLQADYIPQLLTTTAEREALLSAYGEVKMLDFATIQALTAEQFMDILRTKYEVAVLLMGYDHRFGSDRLRTPQDYRRAGERVGIEVVTLNEYTEGEWHVSSTEIRLALESGNIAVANELLGRPYALGGTVVHGNGIGRSLGFPTANIRPDEVHQIIPRAGVYAVNVRTTAFSWTPAIINVGNNPTINKSPITNNQSPITIEVHIPAFEGDLYGEHMDIRFTQFLREEQRFKDLEALREQIKADIDSIRHRDA